MLARLLILALAIPAALSPFNRACRSSTAGASTSITDVEFGDLVNQLSEEGGYFWSNNYISNETSYLHVIQKLEALPRSSGVYIGVGPNQNFTYIATVRPEMAFIVDVRRQNMLEHLLFKVLIEQSSSPSEYLSRLVARPLENSLPRNADITEVVAAVEAAPPDGAFFQKQSDHVLNELRANPALKLREQDYDDVLRIYREFFRQGLNIKYDSWRSFFFPSLKEFILETDSLGEHSNWLSSMESYRYIREMQRSNRIVPVVGDFAGDGALRRLGRLLDSRGTVVSAFYVSNVEFYLFRQRKWDVFVDNLRLLPINSDSVFIRAYANLHRPHPDMVGDHITISLVQNIQHLLESAADGHYRTHWDVVTSKDPN